MSETTIVKLSSVNFVREGVRILQDIDWTIRAGEHWALLGANGSGKTTLLKILTGYEWASSGNVEVLGRGYGSYDLRALRKVIGWVSSALETKIPSQDSAIDVVLSGYEASFGLYREFEPAEIETGEESLKTLNILSLRDRTFCTLSQGEQQRVLIARALINAPKLLVLDEPCAGLDPAAREAFLGDLSALASSSEAPTLIMVTHHIEELGPWVTRCLALRQGKIEAHGVTAQVLTSTTMSRVLHRACRVETANGSYRLYLGT